jgi:hypothetical protein
MPIFLNEATGKFELRCVSKHDDNPILVGEGLLHGLLSIKIEPNPTRAVPRSSTLPVRCYVCSVCGYVELYAISAKDGG